MLLRMFLLLETVVRLILFLKKKRRAGFLSLFLSVTLIVWRKPKSSYHWTSDIEMDARVRRSSTPTPHGRVLEAIKFSFSFKAIELI
jgi:hypothetical protein